MYALTEIGIIEPEGSKWEYQCVKFVIWITFFEIGFALFDSFAIVNSYIAWKNHILKGKPEKHRAYKKYSVREARLALIEIWAKLAMRHYKAPQPHAKKRRRLVLFVHKTVGIKSYYWAQSEFHTAGFKAPWWAHTTTIQVGAKMRNMRWTYQVALLGLYWGYWWYISSLPYERAAMQHEASSNSSGDLAQFVCKISFPKKSCELNE